MEWLEKLYSPGDEPWQVFGKLFSLVIAGLIAWVVCEVFFRSVEGDE